LSQQKTIVAPNQSKIPSIPATTNTGKWQPTRIKQNRKTPDPERSCWLYLHNDITRDIQARRYKGDREQWKTALSAQLG
jgi:hypothetical protein